MHPNECNFTFRTETGQHQIKSQLDRIYVVRHIQQHTFAWKIEASPVPTDHWLVQMKYAPKDMPQTGRGCWTWPLGMIDDPKTIEKVAQCRIKLQEDLAELKNANTNHKTNNPQLLWETFKEEVKKIVRSKNKKVYHKITSKIHNLKKDQTNIAAHPNLDERDDL